MIERGERHRRADAQPLVRAAASTPSMCTDGQTLKVVK
jgi:hypothetical protein